MKTITVVFAMALGLALPAITHGQDADSRPRRGPRPPQGDVNGPEGQRPPRFDAGAPGDGRRPPMPPLFAALDLNHDGVIDAEEISKAAESLKALDKNGDGKLTPDEVRPPRPDGFPAGNEDPNAPGPRRPRARPGGQ